MSHKVKKVNKRTKLKVSKVSLKKLPFDVSNSEVVKRHLWAVNKRVQVRDHLLTLGKLQFG